MGKTLIVVDVESNGPCPGLFSMISFGAVAVEKRGRCEARSFFGETGPLNGAGWQDEAYKIVGVTKEEHQTYPAISETMNKFVQWLKQFPNPVFISDNPAFDWQFINYYMHLTRNSNPFGFSARRIGDIYSGFHKDLTKSSEWKKLRVTKHTHNPVDDARGNAEALIHMADKLGIANIL